MLILTRRIGESLIVGEDVTLTVLAVNGNQVRIGIAAPKNVSVHREEVKKRIDAGILKPRDRINEIVLGDDDDWDEDYES